LAGVSGSPATTAVPDVGARVQRAERPDGRRLAGAVWPEETEHLAVSDLKTHIGERDLSAECLAQARHGQRCRADLGPFLALYCHLGTPSIAKLISV
jgi:hypothetical protein